MLFREKETKEKRQKNKRTEGQRDERRQRDIGYAETCRLCGATEFVLLSEKLRRTLCPLR